MSTTGTHKLLGPSDLLLMSRAVSPVVMKALGTWITMEPTLQAALDRAYTAGATDMRESAAKYVGVTARPTAAAVLALALPTPP